MTIIADIVEVFYTRVNLASAREDSFTGLTKTAVIYFWLLWEFLCLKRVKVTFDVCGVVFSRHLVLDL